MEMGQAKLRINKRKVAIETACTIPIFLRRLLFGYISRCRRSMSQYVDFITNSLEDVRSATGKSHSTSSAMR